MTLGKFFKYLFLLILLIHLMISCQWKNKQGPNEANVDAQFEQYDSSITLPKSKGFINDFENLFSETEEKILDSIITDFETKTTIQIAVATIAPTMTTAEDFDVFTLRLAKNWGVGQKDKDNGILIGISAGLRKIRIQNGYGIEKILSNEDTKLIVDSAFIPAFLQWSYFEGTKTGIVALMDVLGGKLD